MKRIRIHHLAGSLLAIGLLACGAVDEFVGSDDGEIEILTAEQAAAEANASIDEKNADEEFANLKAEIYDDIEDE